MTCTIDVLYLSPEIGVLSSQGVTDKLIVHKVGERDLCVPGIQTADGRLTQWSLQKERKEGH